MKKTNDEFIAEMKQKHPNIIIKGVYQDRATNIEWICSCCGESQFSLPGNLLRPTATGLCRKCFLQQLASKRSKTNEEFLQELHTIHPEIRVTSIYTCADDKVEWECIRCGERQLTAPSNLLNPDATGLCRKCFNLQLAFKRQKTHDEFIQELHRIHPEIIITGVFQGNNRKIEWKCANCGKKSYSMPTNLLKATKTVYCKKCEPLFRNDIPRQQNGEIEAISNRNRNAMRFYEAVGMLKKPPILLNEYRDNKSKIRCKCAVCGYEWSALPRVILSYIHACPICANRDHAIENDVFLERLNKINPYVKPLEEYFRQDQPIKCKCLICDNEWFVTPAGLLRRNGCPKCNHTATSFFEQLVFLSFQEALGNGRVLSRDKKAIGSELDIYIPHLKLAFEYGAWYYHKNRLKNDEKKLARCKSKEIRLIRIYDGCGEEIVEGQDVYSFSKSITNSINEAKDLVQQLFSIAQISFNIDEMTFERIKNEAYLSSRRITTIQFREKIRKIQPTIEVLGEYIGNTEPITCKCKTCGFVWDSTPHKLSAKNACPNCYSISRKKNEEQFIAEVNETNPDIELLEPYTGNDKQILVRCRICGHQWKPYAKNVAHGYGCSVCKKNNDAQKALNEIIVTHPNIEVIGVFHGTNKPIEVKCKQCGNVWTPTVSNLIRNASHCSRCRRKETFKNRRMSTEDFVKRLFDISPMIQLLGEFNGVNNRVDVKCKICGYTWSPKAMDLLTGRGCRKCKYKKQIERQRRTPEQFVQEMKKINPKIQIVGQYTKANNPIEVLCLECGRKWSPHASSLIAGTGCPSCSKKRKNKKKTEFERKN